MGDTGKQRQQVLRGAQQALNVMDWRAAAQALEQAAQLAREAGDDLRTTQCLQMASALHRARGETAQALETAARARKAAADDPRALFAASAERAEASIAADDFVAAVNDYVEALRLARQLQLPPAAMATVMRRLAEARAGAEQFGEAWSGYDEAAQLMVDNDDSLSAAWIDVEHAKQAIACGQHGQARRVVERARFEALEVAEPHLRAERRLLLAQLALADRDGVAAIAQAQAARSAALEGVAPLSYFAAAVTLAQALAERNQKVSAYQVLATAWATLGDLLGRDVAQSWVLPVIEAYRLHWGASVFAEVKATHDQQRRAAMAGSSGIQGGNPI